MATYLVTQANGQQSRWVVKHLLAEGFKVHAVVRNLQKVSAELKDANVTVFQGESQNFEEIFEAAKGCKGVFLNTFPWPGLEIQQAKTVVEACKKAGVEGIVSSTTFGTNDRTIWDDEVTEECQMRDYFRSKAEVEDAVRGAGFKAYTILRPAFIHGDFLLPNVKDNFPALPKSGELDHAFEDGVKTTYIDASDIGKYAVAALKDPSKFNGQEFNLGNESLTMEEVRDILAKVSGRNVTVRRRTPEEVEEAKAYLFGQRFQLMVNVKGFKDAAEAAKEVQGKFGIPFTSLEDALQRDEALLLQCLPDQ